MSLLGTDTGKFLALLSEEAPPTSPSLGRHKIIIIIKKYMLPSEEVNFSFRDFCWGKLASQLPEGLGEREAGACDVPFPGSR